MEKKQHDMQDRREARRKRRQRSQILAYILLIVMMAVLTAALVTGVKFVSDKLQEKQQAMQEQQNVVDELLATEETLTVPETTEETVVELTPEQKLDEIVNAGIEVMPLEDKVAGLFLVTPESITGVSAAIQAGEGTQKALSQYAVGGIIYSAKNIQSAEQLSEMIDNTKLYSKYPLFIAVDEEGGKVSRIADAQLADRVDSAKTIGETQDAGIAYQAGTTIGTYLAELGFNLNFAPVADLANVENSIMAERSYGSDAATVAPFVTSMMQGLTEQGVTACLKHFPGIGSTTEDTHDGLAVTDRSLEEFQANEFAVFRAGIDAGAKMILVGHVSAPALAGDNTPSSLSKAVVTDILREELNYKGVIISDALNVSAISEYYSSEQAAVMALKAGCDMILMPENFQEAYEGVLQAVAEGTISEERINDSLRRIYRIKYADKIAAE